VAPQLPVVAQGAAQQWPPRHWLEAQVPLPLQGSPGPPEPAEAPELPPEVVAPALVPVVPAEAPPE
jgi:hypothetical protein